MRETLRVQHLKYFALIYKNYIFIILISVVLFRIKPSKFSYKSLPLFSCQFHKGLPYFTQGKRKRKKKERDGSGCSKAIFHGDCHVRYHGTPDRGCTACKCSKHITEANVRCINHCTGICYRCLSCFACLRFLLLSHLFA